MKEHIIVAVNAVLPCFLIIALGLLVRWRGMLGEQELSRFNSVAFRIFLPCQIFKNVYDASPGDCLNLRLLFFVGVGLLLAGGLSLLTAQVAEPQRNRRGVMAQGMFRGNYVLLGIPLVTSLFGEEGAGTAAVLLAINVPIYNVLSTLFLDLYSGDEVKPGKLIRDILTNPLIDATAVGLLAKALRLPVYSIEPLSKTISSLGAVATPLCLFILGASFGPASMKSYLRSLWITITYKLLLFPGLAVLAAALLGFRGVELAAILISFGAPTAVNSYNMARELDGDAELAAGIVVTDTALSCLTLFGWIVLLRSLGLF